MSDQDDVSLLIAMREENLARRIDYEMRKRKWSQERMSRAMGEAGYPLHQSSISKITNPKEEGKRRTISVDEAIGFAKVFGVSLDSLLLPLETTRNREAKKLMERIAELTERLKATADELTALWAELHDALDLVEAEAAANAGPISPETTADLIAYLKATVNGIREVERAEALSEANHCLNHHHQHPPTGGGTE